MAAAAAGLFVVLRSLTFLEALGGFVVCLPEGTTTDAASVRSGDREDYPPDGTSGPLFWMVRGQLGGLRGTAPQGCSEGFDSSPESRYPSAQVERGHCAPQASMGALLCHYEDCLPATKEAIPGRRSEAGTGNPRSHGGRQAGCTDDARYCAEWQHHRSPGSDGRQGLGGAHSRRQDGGGAWTRLLAGSHVSCSSGQGLTTGSCHPSETHSNSSSDDPCPQRDRGDGQANCPDVSCHAGQHGTIPSLSWSEQDTASPWPLPRPMGLGWRWEITVHPGRDRSPRTPPGGFL